MKRIGVVLLSVVAGLLAFLLLMPGVAFYSSHSLRATAARSQIEQLMTALKTYRIDVGSFPAEEQGLQALRTDPGVRNWNGPYVERDIPVDPWGHPYRYTIANGRPHILSDGLTPPQR